MASYKDIQGFNIQNLSSDPVPFAQAKENDPYSGVWSSGGNLNQAKNAVAGAGIQTAALAAGGADGTPTGTVNTELYNGTSWTEVNNLNTARYYLGGAGSQTAAIATAGKTDPNIAKSENESWNGTSWTEVNDVNTARWQFGQAGTATASLMASGTTDNTNTTNVTESWNGTSWTEITEVNVARFAAVMTGSQTEALYIGGEKGTPDSGGGAPYVKIGNTEYWNGSTWTELADLNTARNQLGGSGIYTSSLVFAGPPTPTNTESWNGTSWTEVNNLALGGEFRTGAGGNASTPNTTALAIGASPPLSAATEEWTFSGIPPTAPAAGYSDAIVGQIYYNTSTGSFKAIKAGGAPIGTWSSGGNLPLALSKTAGFGTQTATIAVGGYNAPFTPPFAYFLSYDGTSWTSLGTYPKSTYAAASAGSQTDALIMGGSTGTPTIYSSVESYNGSTWTAGTSMPYSASYAGSSVKGTSTAALHFGGDPGTVTTTVSYNGSAWTTVNSLNAGRRGLASSGTQTDALAIGGSTGVPNTITTNVESWDGTNWTEIANLNTARNDIQGTGDSTISAIAYAGSVPPPSALTEVWNGTSWTEVADLSTSRSDLGSSGNTSAALAIGGSPAIASTEEFTAADFTINTLTTS